MIPEYYMCEAERVDNGESVRGERITFLDKVLIIDNKTGAGPLRKIPRPGLYTFECYVYEVKPETVRRVVAVKPRKSVSMEITGVCPNCSLAFIRKDNFCFHCGMAIDWSGAE